MIGECDIRATVLPATALFCWFHRESRAPVAIGMSASATIRLANLASAETRILGQQWVESRYGAVAVGRTYLLPPPFRLAVPHWLGHGSVSTPRSSVGRVEGMGIAN